MKIFKLIYLVPLAVVLSCSPTDMDSPSPESVFVKYFGNSGLHKAVDVVFNEARNEYFILGTQNLGTGTLEDFYYVIADEGGNVIAERSISFADSVGDRIDVPMRLKQINDDEYLVVGTSTDLEENSNIRWGVVNHDITQDATYFTIDNTGHDLVAADILKVTGEDNVVVLGSAFTLESGDQTSSPQERQFFISKRQISDGAKVWKKTLGYPGDDDALSIFENNDGGYALFGTTELVQSNYTGKNVLVVFTTPLGTPDGTSFAYGFGPGNNDIPQEVVKVGNSYKVVGNSVSGTNSAAFFMGVTSFGTLDNNAAVPGLLSNSFNLNSQAFTLTRTYNGNYLVMGSYPDFSTNLTETGISESRLEEMMILKTNALGERPEGQGFEQFDQYYGLESGNDRANKAITLPGGKVAVVGTFDFGSGTTLIGLLKLNNNGQLRN